MLIERLLATGTEIVTPHCVTTPRGRTFDRNAWSDGGRLHLEDRPGGPDPARAHPVRGPTLPRSADAPAAPSGAETVLHFAMPSHMRPQSGARNVNYTMFEADRIPADWAARARLCERVAVPTRASRNAWIASGVDPARVRVSPLGVD